MKLVILFLNLLLISCNFRQSEINNQFDIKYNIVTTAEDKSTLNILVKYLGGNKEIWSQDKGFLKYSLRGKFTEDEYHGSKISIIPRTSYKLMPGDTVQKSINIDNYQSYKSYDVNLIYFKTKFDSDNNKNEQIIYSIKLK